MPNPHSLFRLASKIYNTPHLITPENFNTILDYLEQRNSDAFEMSYNDNDPYAEAPKPYANGLGVLRVDGSLTYKPVFALCEATTSYQELIEQTEEMAAAGVRTIVMEVTSGGGEAGHCFETASEIRAVCDEHNIKLIGYADTQACSAAYALISVCDEVVANPSACIGSIGCVIALLDTSKAMQKAGYKRVFITSGKSKVPFEADGSFKQDFLDRLQGEVDRLNAEFTTHVSQHTGLDAATIMGFEAQVFNANEAVEKGLANKVMTTKEFAKYVASVHGA